MVTRTAANDRGRLWLTIKSCNFNPLRLALQAICAPPRHTTPMGLPSFLPARRNNFSLRKQVKELLREEETCKADRRAPLRDPHHIQVVLHAVQPEPRTFPRRAAPSRTSLSPRNQTPKPKTQSLLLAPRHPEFSLRCAIQNLPQGSSRAAKTQNLLLAPRNLEPSLRSQIPSLPGLNRSALVVMAACRYTWLRCPTTSHTGTGIHTFSPWLRCYLIMGTDSMLPGVYVRVAGARCQISPWRSFVHALNGMWQDCSLTRLQSDENKTTGWSLGSDRGPPKRRLRSC